MDDLVEVKAPLEQEGTKAVVRNWLKQPGEAVLLDDPLVELETDKVTQEVPAPVAGVLEEIFLRSGEDAVPGVVLGRIRVGAAKAARDTLVERPPAAAEVADGTFHPSRFSPAVRRAAEQYGIDPAEVTGTGKGGRVTRKDMDAAFAARGPDTAPPPAVPERPAPQFFPEAGTPPAPPLSEPSAGSHVVAHSPMRLAIAGHMAESLAAAPHVTAVFEADFSAIMRHRGANRERMAAEGVSLSYTAYLVAASVAAMRAVPEINSRWHADRLEIFDDVNIGIGTALGDKGLVVPVIRKAQHLSLSGIAAQLQDLTNRARIGRLSPADVKGGTFTISNHGVSGSLLAAPIIINQPQAAILGVGKLEKRVVVREVDGVDTIQIRPMAYVSLTIDHRAVDGHQTNAWLSHFVRTLEGWPS
ncbi:dihydrolipoamide acetyltransferase component of pyruvate dehydrogenase complex [Mesorhizobium sp. L-8-10]|uniref:dihydrolipoamide acetyltransferase family protein n=1 Tax=Mesorhizobium sp. L-8-10 TaxID=2744523 RepID=UPI00192637AA|nr:2-oxo acid dehydrogenase subunit E2 [Mesorhizobium sp. L-8-10]BCH28472.1 dihydrolipoamide acetyltransferase component of pyruvate dehydrogenase complex [Mesorhizobium sp. L-8-10]